LTAANDLKTYELRIDLEHFSGARRFAKYSEFKIASEHLNYELVALGTYSGTAGIVVQNTTCVYNLRYKVSSVFSASSESEKERKLCYRRENRAMPL